MKKIFLFIFMLLISIIFMKGYNTSADENHPDYYNMIDFDDVTVDDMASGQCSMNNSITFESGEDYSMICTANFLCDAVPTKQSQNYVIEYEEDNQTYTETLSVYIMNGGLYFFDMSDLMGRTVTLLDLITRGHTQDTLPHDECIIFKGSCYDFKGFRKKENYSTSYQYYTDTLNIYTYTDSMIEKSTLEDMIISYDNVKGDITDKLVYNYGDYDPASKKAGEYNITVSSSDSVNTSYLKIRLVAVDNTAPTISGPSEIYWDLNSDPLTEEDILSNFTITDNKSNPENITVKLSGYSTNFFTVNQRAAYNMTITATDENNNTATKSFLLRPLDNCTPEITLKDTTLYMSKMGDFTDESLKKLLVSSITNNGTDYKLEFSFDCDLGEVAKPGSYKVTVTLTNYYNKVATSSATLTVIDDISPEFYVKSFVLNLTSDTPYSDSEFISYISNNLQSRGIAFETVNIISTNYSADKEGSYDLVYSYTYGDTVNYEEATINNTIVKNKTYNWIYALISIPAVLSLGLFIGINNKKKKKINRIS